MPVTSNDVANQALQLVGDNMPAVSGQAPNFDDSTAGQALRWMYTPCVQTVMRQFEFDFARNVQVLQVTANPPPMGWGFEYLYPSFAVEIWQVMPSQADVDPFNPKPVNWLVGNNLVTGTQTKVIWCDAEDAEAVLNDQPTENTWDATFRESVVRLLANGLAIALQGRPETADSQMQAFKAFIGVAEQRGG